MNEIDDIKKLIDLMVERKDVYITIYSGENGKSISIYPLIDDEEEKKNSDVIPNIDLDNVDMSELVGASKNVLYELGKVLVKVYKPEEETVNKYDITIDVEQIGECTLKANKDMDTLIKSLKKDSNLETDTPEPVEEKTEDPLNEKIRLSRGALLEGLRRYCRDRECLVCDIQSDCNRLGKFETLSGSQLSDLFDKAYKKEEE